MTRRPPLFLAREEYRRRRLRDAARLLPLLGLCLFLMPVVWSGSPGAPGTATGGVYLFVGWAVLVAAAALLAGPLGRAGGSETVLPTRLPGHLADQLPEHRDDHPVGSMAPDQPPGAPPVDLQSGAQPDDSPPPARPGGRDAV